MWRVTRLQDDDDDLPQVLESLDLPGIAKYIQSKACKHIFVMVRSNCVTDLRTETDMTCRREQVVCVWWDLL